MEKYRVACFGEVLWDVLPGGRKLGGAPLNVAYHLNCLGTPAVMISRIGADEDGKQILLEMQQRHLSAAFIQTDAAHATSTVNAVPGPHNEMSYVFTPDIAWDHIALQPELIHLVSNCDVFVYGSLAAREHTTHQTLLQLLQVARRKVFDINLRAPHYTQATVEELLHLADVVKMNENELALLAGWYGIAGGEEDIVLELMKRFGAECMIVTKGAEGAFLRVNNRFYHHTGYNVQVADTVGSGDSFLAAILSQTLQGAAPQAALDYACKVGALVASKTGGTPAYTQQEVLQIA